MRIAIIGAGAAGCFASIEIKRQLPDAEVIVIEKGRKALAKVAITGGGRCNLTNSFRDVRSLEQVYPRGHRLMKKLLHHFSHEDTFDWFEREGIRLVTQEDQCVFPQSQNAMEIVDTLLRLMRNLGVKLMCSTKVERIIPKEDGTYSLQTISGDSKEDKILQIEGLDAVLVTIGGHPTHKGYSLLEGLDVEIIQPRPSLFSLCIDDDSLKTLMGTVVEKTVISIPGTKLKAEGPLLVTHWGISGPAVLKLSSHGAVYLAEKVYVAEVAVNWLAEMTHDEVREHLEDLHRENGNKKLVSVYHTALNARLWHHLLLRAKLSSEARWKEMSTKEMNRLHNTLTNDIYRVTGKNRFKDEFVTAGGISLSSVSQKTLEAKKHPGLFFAGEALDVDAVTGGFNLQAAWTMGYIAAQNIATMSQAPH